MSTYALISIGPLGHEQLIAEYTRRSEALRARDDLHEQNWLMGRPERREAYAVHDHDGEHEWDDQRYCLECQDVLVKAGGTCSECLSEQASYYMLDEGGQG